MAGDEGSMLLHYDLLKSGLKSLRDSETLCDITLEATGVRVKGHRCVLAACSQYFSAMFTGSFQESHSSKVTLKGITGEALKAVVDFVYTGEVDTGLEFASMKAILEAAHMLQLNLLLDKCIKYIAEHQEIDTCLQYLQVAKELQLSELEEKLNAFVRQNFVDVSKTPAFLDISKKTLLDLLASDDTIGPEYELFLAAERWLVHKPERSENNVEIMGNIRFGFMKSEEVARHIMSSVLMKEDNLRNFFSETFEDLASPTQFPLALNDKYHPRDAVECMVILDMENKSTVAFPFQKGDQKAFYLTPMPCQCLAAVPVICNSFLFILGGEVAGVASPAVQRYNTFTNQWMLMSPMSRSRKNHSACRMGDSIIMIGGSVTSNGPLLQSVERYSIKQDVWEPMPDLPVGLLKAACCVHDGELYVSGGVLSNTRSASDRFYHFCKAGQLWERKSSLPAPRIDHLMCSTRKGLFVCGGYQVEYDNQTLKFVRDVSLYNASTDQWTDIPALCSFFGTPSARLFTSQNSERYVFAFKKGSGNNQDNTPMVMYRIIIIPGSTDASPTLKVSDSSVNMVKLKYKPFNYPAILSKIPNKFLK